MFRLPLYCASLLFLLPFFSFSQEQDWKLAKSGDGIDIYTRLAENSKFKETRAEVVIQKEAEFLLKIINDYSRNY